MKKRKLSTYAIFALTGAMLMTACGGGASSSAVPASSIPPSSIVPSSQPSSELEHYYVIDVNSIRTEMLINTTQVLDVKFTDLGQAATPKYSVKVTLEGQDVTATVYTEGTKVFAPKVVGSYDVLITVLNEKGEPYKTKDGATFTKNVKIEAVTQSFAPRDQAGPDISISKEGVMTFGESYASAGKKQTSNQYKVTGVTFDGSYSITYELNDIHVDPNYNDPAFYFGWIKDWKENNDDCFKLSTANGSMATWIWGKNGDLADLSVNRAQGWSKGGWWDAPGSVTGGSGFDRNKHTITFERFLNEEKESCVFGIQFDNQPFTYLDVGDAYSKVLTNVWVESNNTAGSIRVKEYKVIEDKVAPTIELDFNDEYYLGDSITLKNSCSITDDSVYGPKLVPSFKVLDSEGEECEVVNGVFAPEAVGEYKIVATANDLMKNSASAEQTITVAAEDPKATKIDLTQTASATLDDVGIVIYASATKEGADVAITGYKAFNADGEEVTESVIRKYESKDKSLKYDYFQAAEAGVYTLVAVAEDGTERSKEINVGVENTKIYEWTAYDLSSLIYKDKLIIGKDGTLIFKNNGATDGQTIKLGQGVKQLNEWTVEYKITDLSYSAMGKFF